MMCWHLFSVCFNHSVLLHYFSDLVAVAVVSEAAPVTGCCTALGDIFLTCRCQDQFVHLTLKTQVTVWIKWHSLTQLNINQVGLPLLV